MAKRGMKSAGKNFIKMLLLMGCAALAAFWLLTLSPIDPLQQNVGQAALGSMSPEQIAKLEAYWGADTPPLERFFAWAKGMLQGDFGTSLLYRRPVLEVIGSKLAGSVWLLVLAWVFSGLLGFCMGVLAGAAVAAVSSKVMNSGHKKASHMRKSAGKAMHSVGNLIGDVEKMLR